MRAGIIAALLVFCGLCYTQNYATVKLFDTGNTADSLVAKTDCILLGFLISYKADSLSVPDSIKGSFTFFSVVNKVTSAGVGRKKEGITREKDSLRVFFVAPKGMHLPYDSLAKARLFICLLQCTGNNCYTLNFPVAAKGAEAYMEFASIVEDIRSQQFKPLISYKSKTFRKEAFYMRYTMAFAKDSLILYDSICSYIYEKERSKKHQVFLNKKGQVLMHGMLKRYNRGRQSVYGKSGKWVYCNAQGKVILKRREKLPRIRKNLKEA